MQACEYVILICLLTSTNVNFCDIAVSWLRQTQPFWDYISRIFRSFWIFWSFFRKLKQKKSMGSFIKENKVNFQKRAWSLSKRKTITRNGKTCTYLCIQLDSLECEIKLHSIVYWLCNSYVFIFCKKHFQNQTMFKKKDIQDKTSVAFFWLTNFSLLFAAVFQANPAVFICKK